MVSETIDSYAKRAMLRYGRTVVEQRLESYRAQNFPNYEITQDGQVLAIKNGRYLRQTISKQGYLRVSLSNVDGVRYTFAVHRLVALTWIPRVIGKNIVNHLDGNKSNNHSHNLEWVTQQENSQHAVDTGLTQTNRNVRVAKYTVGGKFLQVYASLKQAALAVGLSSGNICSVIKGIQKTAGGFQWAGLQTNGKPLLKLPPVKPKILTKVPVAQYTTNGQLVRVFDSIREAASFVGCTDGNICAVLSGRTSTANGFKWRYLKDSTRKITATVTSKLRDNKHINHCRRVSMGVTHNAIDANFFVNYEIEKDGRVWSLLSKKFLKTRVSSVGYAQVCLSSNGNTKTFLVHRLVALAWLPRIVGKNIVNHKDGNKVNNHASNLEWSTPSDNTQHAWKTGLSVPSVVSIAQYSESGKFLRVFDSMTAAAQQAGCSVGNIGGVARGERSLAGGFQWAYLQGNGKPLSKLPPVKPLRVPVAQYTKNGKFLRVFVSVKEAAEIVGCNAGTISSVLVSRTNTAGGCQWARLQSNGTPLPKLPPVKPTLAQVAQYTISGKFLCVFGSIAAAANSVGCAASGISAVLAGKGQTLKYFRWARLQGNGKLLAKLPPLELPKTTPVAQYTISGKFLRVYNSFNEAATVVGCGQNSIRGVVAGRRNSVCGFRWARLSKNNRPLPKLPPLSKSQPQMKPVRNITTGEIFTTHEEICAAGYLPTCVAAVVAGKSHTHAGCCWQKITGENNGNY